MKEILYNLALIDAINFCKANGIDCSGTHLYKYPRRFTYALVRDTDGLSLLTTTFYKNQVPVHSINSNIETRRMRLNRIMHYERTQGLLANK